MKTYKYPITKLESNQVFVFGSNTQGRHGKGAALWAKNNAGAIYGQASGLQGNSYAIITKDLTKFKHPSIDSYQIRNQIRTLYCHAKENPKTEYLIAYTNKPNLNGYTPEDMALFFLQSGEIPDNIIFEESFLKLINNLYS